MVEKLIEMVWVFEPVTWLVFLVIFLIALAVLIEAFERCFGLGKRD